MPAAYSADIRGRVIASVESGSSRRRGAAGCENRACLRIAQTTSSSVKSGCPSISVSKKFAYFSRGEVLPPRGLAAQLPVVR